MVDRPRVLAHGTLARVARVEHPRPRIGITFPPDPRDTQGQPQIQRTLRELERELGLREVAGRLFQLDGQESPERAALTNGERRQAERTGDAAFPDLVRAHLPELRAARSWVELEERLTAHGLRLERKGQGLVITDGEHQVKASRVARDLSLRRLEARFGVSYPEREASEGVPERARQSLSPAVEQVRGAIDEHERVVALKTERTRAEQDLAAARERLQRLDGALERVQHASRRFDAALARVYQQSSAYVGCSTRSSAPRASACWNAALDGSWTTCCRARSHSCAACSLPHRRPLPSRLERS